MDNELAVIVYKTSMLSPNDIKNAIDDMGFEASFFPEESSLVVNIQGMTCQSCVKNIEGTISSLEGILNIKVNIIHYAIIWFFLN